MTDPHAANPKPDALGQERADLQSAKDAIEQARESGDAQALEQAREARHHLKDEIRGERDAEHGQRDSGRGQAPADSGSAGSPSS